MMAATPVTLNEQDKPIADFVFNAQNRAEDIALVWAMGFEVDDENKPAPKNIPQPDQPLFHLGGVSTKGRSGADSGRRWCQVRHSQRLLRVRRLALRWQSWVCSMV